MALWAVLTLRILNAETIKKTYVQDVVTYALLQVSKAEI